jgi:UDP-2-acetamido-3-amino-2,3-dideoxy-glucuronate N-acetyltransferase
MPLNGVFVHRMALCESEQVGSGTKIWAFAHVMADARIGTDCNICDHAFIESGASLGDRVTVKNNVLIWNKVTIADDVFVGPNVVFTNDLLPRVKFKHSEDEFLPTVVEEGVSLGANSTIVCGVTIGRHAMVGAGTVVTGDVPAFALAVGNPGRQVGWVCECGLRLPESLGCSCGRTYAESSRGLAPQRT